jgi:hypothetical protein
MEDQDLRRLLQLINELHRASTTVLSDFVAHEVPRALAIVELTTNTALQERGHRVLAEATNVQTQAAALRRELEALRSELQQDRVDSASGNT